MPRRNPLLDGRNENRRNRENRANNGGGGGGGGGNNNKKKREKEDPIVDPNAGGAGKDGEIDETEAGNWATTNPEEYFKGFRDTYSTGDTRFDEWYNRTLYDQMHTDYLSQVMSVGGTPAETTWQDYLDANLNTANVNQRWGDYFADNYRQEATINAMRRGGNEAAGNNASNFGRWLSEKMAPRLQADWQANGGTMSFNDYLNNQVNSGASSQYYNDYVMDPSRWQQTYNMGRWQAF